MPDFFFPRERNRVLHDPVPTGRYLQGGVWVSYGDGISGSETMIDEVHNFNPRGSSTYGDVGGPMTHKRNRTVYDRMLTTSQSNIQGTVGIGIVSGFLPSPATPISDFTLAGRGTTLIARSLPTNPAASLSTFLGELREDGLPHLPGSAARETTSVARSAGSEYLNVEFGWLPFVSDLRKFAYAVKHSHEILSHYVKQSDKKIRVRYGFPSTSSTRVSYAGGFANPLGMNIAMTGSVSEQTEDKTWFSGAFRYHVPVGNSTWSRLARYEALSNHLLGSRITPETVWNVAPWSWAVDWFTNTGDVIHNISALATDGLVMQYGYAMNTVSSVCRYQYKVVNPSSYGLPSDGLLSATYEQLWSRRIAANPFGFSATDLSLTKRQTAVLAALGLTRGQRQAPGKRHPRPIP